MKPNKTEDPGAPNRVYWQVTIRMCGTERSAEHVEKMFSRAIHNDEDLSDRLEAGEVDVKAENFGLIRVNQETNFVVPLPSLH